MVYFFDTSALVKRYHREAGTEVVDAAFEAQDATCVISDLSVIESYSAFAKNVRTGAIDEADFRLMRRALARDVQDGVLQIIALSPIDKQEAVTLIETYGVPQSLRTLDALQLAIMKRQGPDRIARVYGADQQLVAVVEAEGFTVENPARTSRR